IGPTGSAGQTGATGPQGNRGSDGDEGPEGPIGPPGERGSTGSAGSNGATGPAGSQGMQGEDGESFDSWPVSIPDDARWAMGPWAWRGVIQPAAITVSQNDYSPTGLAKCSVIRLEASGGGLSLTGIDSTGCIDGTIKVIQMG